MGDPSPVRILGVVTLVVTALLATAYALGRSLVPDPADPRATGGVVRQEQPDHADQPPDRGTTPGDPDGAAPTADPTPDTTEDGPYGSRMTTGTAEVALTFDDGPDPTYTPQALALLRKHRVKATFCVVGENVLAHPDLVRAIVADGHTLCNHSWNHDVLLGGRSQQQIQADLLRTNEAIRRAVPGARIEYFRQPGGNWTWSVVSVARQLGMTSLHWTVDPNDWKAPGAGSITATVTAGTAAGSIVLLHDAGGDRQDTMDALRTILPNLTGRFRLAALPTGTT